MTGQTTAILLNPSAGGGRALRLKRRLEKRLAAWEISHTLIVTSSEEDLRIKTGELGRSVDVIVGAGGDSTFRIMANVILDEKLDVRLGMIALGSSNDIVREFDLLSLDSACEALKRGQSRRIDLGGIYAGGHLQMVFLGQASLGLGVSVNRYVAQWRTENSLRAKNQIVAGILGIVKSYRSGDIPIDLNINIRDAVQSHRLDLAVFSNTRYWASGKVITPGASPTDGLLDACLIEDCSLRRLSHLAVKALRGKHMEEREVTIRRSDVFRLSASRPFSIQADGDILGGTEKPDLYKSIEIRALPAAISLMT